MKSFILKNKYKIAIAFSILLIALISIILYFNIPRLSYSYSDTYKGYIVDNAFGNSKSYKVSDEINGKPVVGIGKRAFFRHSNLEKIEFENEKNIKVIEKLAFAECPKLSEIDLRYVQEIERNAFMYDKSLKNINLSAKNIGASAFYKCTSLENIELNIGVKTIGSMAFSETKIKEIVIPNGVIDVAVDAFIYCDNLEKIVVKSKLLLENEYLKSLNNVVFEVEWWNHY